MLKKRPRGRPWPKGTSGNPRGRPRGARNRWTQAILQIKAQSAGLKFLDACRPYESWDGYFWQDGLRFRKDTLEAFPHDGPPPEPPKRFNPRERHTEITWKRRRLYLQNGWAFDPATWDRVRL